MPKKSVYTLVALFTWISLVWLNWPGQDKRVHPEAPKVTTGSGDSKAESAPIIAEQETSFETKTGTDPTEASRRWLDPMIIRTLNTQTTWNDTGTEKKVVSIVEADFHNPYLRIEETYTVNRYNGQQTLSSYTASTADTILVKMHKDLSEDGLDAFSAEHGVVRHKKLPGTGILEMKFSDYNHPDRLPDMLSRLESDIDLVAIAEPDYLTRGLAVTPNDGFFNRQEGFNNPSFGEFNLDIDAPEAWAIRSTAPSVIVAVLDSGINPNHEDLINNLWRNVREADNLQDDDGNGYIDDLIGVNLIEETGDPTDENGHGTHVAGILGAQGNNSKGIAGVAWDVQILAIKHLDENNIGQISDALEGIQYALEKDVNILNNSWGTTGYSSLLKDQLQAASDHGIIIVTAAGNDSSRLSDTPIYPAAFSIPNQVVVGASSSQDGLASYSNYDEDLVHLFAPGSAYSTYWDGYQELSGTSMAAPLVSGTLALLKQEFPQLTTPALITRLLDSVELRSTLQGRSLTGGRLNVYRALLGESNVPENDNFSKAHILNSSGDKRSGTLSLATIEPNEPTPFLGQAINTVWYQWTAGSSNGANVSVNFGNYEGFIALYSGLQQTALTRIGESSVQSFTTSANIEMATSPGTTYIIQVGSITGITGPFTIEVAEFPANDSLRTPFVLEGETFEIQGSTQQATREDSDPEIHPGESDRNVWYSWVAPKSGTFYLSLSDALGQMFLKIFKDTGLSLIESSVTLDAGSLNNQIFEAEEAERYIIGVTSQSSKGSPFRLHGQFVGEARIIAQPADQLVPEGGTATFRVGVIGDGIPSYEWFHNGSPISDSNVNTLKRFNVGEEDLGDYFVKISLGSSNLTSQVASLSFSSVGASILAHPQHRIAELGSDLSFRILVSSASEGSIQWFQDSTAISGANSQTLDLNEISHSDAGFYHAEFSHQGNKSISKKAYLRVIENDNILGGTIWTGTPWHHPGVKIIRWVGDYFFAWSEDERLGYSKNGKDWQYTAVPDSDFVESLAYGDGKYLAATNQGIFLSTNAADWTQVHDSPHAYQIAYGNGHFLAATEFGVYRSSDGFTWTKTGDGTLTGGQSIAYGNGKFICHQGSNSTWSSEDGINWTKVANPPLVTRNTLHFVDGKFWNGVPGSPSVHTSEDGSSWTSIPGPEGNINDFFFEFATDRVFVLGQTHFWEWIEDAWVPKQSLPSGISYTIGAFTFREHQFYATLSGHPGLLTDLINSNLSEEKTILQDYNFRDGNFVAKADNETYRSTDGVTWTRFPGNEDPSIVAEAFGKDTYVRIRDLDVEYSTDGNSWSTAGTLQLSRRAVLKFLNDRFVLISSHSFRTSPDGITWQIANREQDHSDNHVTYGNGTFMRADDVLWKSTDALNWTQQPNWPFDFNTSELVGLTFFQDRFIAVGREAILESEDGTTWTVINTDLQPHHPFVIVQSNQSLLIGTLGGPFIWQLNQTQSPILKVNGPPLGSILNLGVPIKYSLQAFGQGNPVSRIRLLQNGIQIQELDPNANSFSIQPDELGFHHIEIEVTDSGENSSRQSVTFTLQGNRVETSSRQTVSPSDIIYYKGAFLAAGPAGVVYHSIDGKYWQRIQTPGTRRISKFAYNDIGICGLSQDDDLLFSPNGLEWIQITGLQIFLDDIPQPKSYFAFPNRDQFGDLIYSIDGYNWWSENGQELIAGFEIPDLSEIEPAFLDTSNYLYYGAPGAGTDVVLWNGLNPAQTGAVFKGWFYKEHGKESMVRTQDGESWFPVGSDINDFWIDHFAVTEEGIFVLRDDGPDKRQITHVSFDGENWFAAPGPSVEGNISYWEGTYYCSNSVGLYQSENGFDWAWIASSPFEGHSLFFEKKLVASPIGFLAIQFDQNDGAQLAFLTEGRSWEVITSDLAETVRPIFGGNQKGFAFGRSPYRLGWIPDQGWHETASDITENATFGKGIFIDTDRGTDGIRTSSDGLSWTAVDRPSWIPNTDNPYYFDGEVFWFVERSDQIIGYSIDGKVWDQKTYPDPNWYNGEIPIVRFGETIYAGNARSTDDGNSWSLSIDPQRYGTYIQFARTNEKVIALVEPGGEPQFLIHENNNWVSYPVPEKHHNYKLVATDDTFYYLSEWLWSSTDGKEWQRMALVGGQPFPGVIDDKIFWGLDYHEGITGLSLDDIALENLIAEFSELGLGDSLNTEVILQNKSPDALQIETATIELLLSQERGHYGRDSEGFGIITSTQLNNLLLQPGETVSTTATIEIPNDARSGNYFLSGRVLDSTLPYDANSVNNYLIQTAEPTVTIPQRLINLEIDGSGLVSTSSPLDQISHGQTVVFAAKPHLGFEFSHWSGDVNDAKEILTLEIKEDLHLTAHFVRRKLAILVEQQGNGAINGIPDQGLTEYGSQVDLSSQAEPGWNFIGWFGDKTSGEPTLQLDVYRDLQLIARFGQSMDNWLSERYSELELENPEISGFQADPDKNGFNNLQEYLFGLDVGSSKPPKFEIHRQGNEICLRYWRNLTALGEAQLKVSYSSDLQTWDDSKITTRNVGTEGGFEIVEACLNHPGDEPIFFEIRAIAE